MAKGYIIGQVDISDPDRYQDYVKADTPVFEKYGATFLVRGGESTLVEGGARSRQVVIEFESYERALECYRSPEYQQAAAIRHECAISDMIIVKGVE